MNAAFTICSNNYLAQAKVLTDSFNEFERESVLFLILVDKKTDSIPYLELFPEARVLEVDSSIVPDLDLMIKRYNIVELNTSVKPFIFDYLFKTGAYSRILYFDPDIKIFSSLKPVFQLLEGSSAVLTPHFLSPLPVDGKTPFENVALNYGIYNLGFLGLNLEHPSTRNLLDWWSIRTCRFGYSKVSEGYFVDQLWFNLVPLFFKGVRILDNPGLNMAPWNLHERFLDYGNDVDQQIMVNGEPLVFYHFSSFSHTSPDLLSKYYDRYSFEDREDLRKIYKDYYNQLLQNQVEKYSAMDCALNIVKYKPRLKNKIWAAVKPLMRKIWDKI